MIKLWSKFNSAAFAGLRCCAGCCGACTVTERFNKNFSTVNAYLGFGTGCGRAGNMFVAASRKSKN